MIDGSGVGVKAKSIRASVLTIAHGRDWAGFPIRCSPRFFYQAALNSAADT